MRIGEVAELVGISARAIRHYHRIGLVPEPARRANGYRDYEAETVLLLLRVRRLVALGVGLREAKELLAEEDPRPAREVLQALDAELAREEARLLSRRRAVQELLRGALEHELLRHPDLVLLVAELHKAFPESSATALEQQALDLLSHLTPEQVPVVIDRYRAALADPVRREQAREVDRRFTGLAGLASDDAEVEAVARLIVASSGVSSAVSAAPEPRAALSIDLLAASLTASQRRCVELVAALSGAGSSE